MSNRFMVFYIDNECYGIDISYVEEIVAVVKTTKIPKTPDFFHGVMNLRGNIVPVVSLRKKLNVKNREIDDRTAIIIVSIYDVILGFIVDTVDEVITCEKAQIQESPKMHTIINTSLIKNMVKEENRVVMILDLEKIFSYDEISFVDINS